MRRAFVVALGLFAACWAERALACAGCRNPTLPVSRGSEGPLGHGKLRLAGTLTGTAVHVVHEAGCRDLAQCDEVPVQPLYLHDQRLYPLELRLAGEYGVNEAFGLELQLPFRVVHTTVEYTTPEGAPYEPLDPDVHHRNETVAGPADPWLLGRVGGSVEGFWLAARLGVTLPLGRTEEDPFELGDQGIRHQHIQLGSGTFDPVAVLEADRAFGDVRIQAFVQGQSSLYENRHGYRAPWRVYGGGSVGATLVEPLAGALGVEALHESSERWDGEVRQDGNLGRSEIFAAGTLSLLLGETQLSLAVRVPFYRHIVVGDEPPGTLESPLIVTLGVSQVLSLYEPELADRLPE